MILEKTNSNEASSGSGFAHVGCPQNVAQKLVWESGPLTGIGARDPAQLEKDTDGFAGPRYIWKYHFVFHAQRITQELQQTAPPTNGSGQIGLICGQICLVFEQVDLICEQTSPACKQTFQIYAKISLICKQISLTCEQSNLICVEVFLICKKELPFGFSTFQCFHFISSPILQLSLSGQSKQWNYIICHRISWQHEHASHSYMSVSLFTISQYIYFHI